MYHIIGNKTIYLQLFLYRFLPMQKCTGFHQKNCCDGIPFEIRRNAFNTETRKTLAEYDEMKTHSEKYKRYHSFSDLVKDIDNEA